MSTDGSHEFQYARTMSLRDWFAGQALVGALHYREHLDYPEMAADAYAVADAMLKERE